MFTKIKFFFWKIKNRKMLVDLHEQIKSSVFLESNSRVCSSYNDYLYDNFGPKNKVEVD